MTAHSAPMSRRGPDLTAATRRAGRPVWFAAAACAAVIASVLAGAGPAAAATPQTPQPITALVSCPGMAPFVVTSPTLPSAVGVGQQVVAVLPEGLFHGQMPADLVMFCSLTEDGQTFNNVPFLIAPTTH
jgi:hypothetical protein